MSEFQSAGWANSSFKDDNSGKLIVLFHTVQKKMEMESLKQQRPVFKEVIHITKIVPGDGKLVIDRPLRESDKEEFADRWEHFQRTQENKVVGFPLENWHSLTDTQKAEFKAMNIQTVEQFANLSDATCQKIMGGGDLRAKARVFIEAGKDAEMLSKIRAEYDEKTAKQDAEIAELRAMLEKLTAPKEAVA